MRHFYGVQFLNKRVKSIAIFHQLFQTAFVFLQYLQNMDKTWNKYNSTNQLHLYKQRPNLKNLSRGLNPPKPGLNLAPA